MTCNCCHAPTEGKQTLCPSCSAFHNRGSSATLTAKQLQVLDFIRGYVREEKIAPRYRDICNFTGRQMATVHSHVVALRTKGLVGTDGHGPRGLYLTEAGLRFGADQLSPEEVKRIENLRGAGKPGVAAGNLFEDIRFLIQVVDKVTA
ncbi:hypothetical protein LCGC14_1670290 [marine sediment metagenome]|uniref:LexA repressor DNA-binding domain-containing protein n=1 Tax=marine sediment metagenome TaxID=412755 RepID=A0A0F9HRH5_9ZZZZ